MMDFFQKLFDTSDFPARWTCGNWTEGHGWLHIISDVATWAAYMAIPLSLAYFVMRRKDVVFPRIFWFFCLFIFSCGAVHLVEAVIFWAPIYRVSGVIKFVTALASWMTVFALIKALPEALKLPGLVAVNTQLAKEIEERKSAETKLQAYAAELRRSNEDLDDFAYIASHDLKAPLRNISALAGWVRNDVGDSLPEKSQKHLSLLGQRVRRMEMLLDDLLGYSRAGRAQEPAREIKSLRLVQSLIPMLSAPEGFKFEISPDLPELYSPAAPLELVFRNLMDNAVKHRVRDDGQVTISAKDAGDFVEFSVEDDGAGIAPEFHEKVFKIFQTLRSREEVEGSGMGLAVIKRTVEKFGGDITLESQLGSGSTFRFTWPKRYELVEAAE